jgi:hypothetical protein
MQEERKSTQLQIKNSLNKEKGAERQVKKFMLKMKLAFGSQFSDNLTNKLYQSEM